ncbi:MAG: hypothetical protein GX272_09240 [Epulopiscium sp.]|nr:hypothetical protein [Candidatus Epulonipiscium sp.]
MDSFRYFLECYFNCSTNYNELNELIDEFKDTEKSSNVNKVISELQSIINSKNLSIAQIYIKKYGMRNMDIDKVLLLVEFILEKLIQKQRENLDTNIFYK